MNNDAYALSLPVGLLAHYPADGMQLMVGDKAGPHEQLDVYISSGDYFLTLITTLDTILAELPKHEIATRIALERVVRDLEYIERQYTVAKKNTTV